MTWNREYFGDGDELSAEDNEECFEPEEGGAEESFGAGGREDADSWIQEFQQKAGLQERAEWAEEFSQEAADPWIVEFRQQNTDLFAPQSNGEEDFEKLSESAAALLATLEAEADDKLRNSQFVAYLRRLASGEPADAVPREDIERSQTAFDEWREEFRRNIEPLVTDEDRVWEEAWVKDWQRYGAEGIGYEGFAASEFRRYQFSPNNPFTGQPEESLARQLASARSVQDGILIAESLLQARPTAQLWSSLGMLQSDNEMDVQAIAAHQQALSMDRSLLRSWMGLALACINERCMSDAYDAMESWLRLHPTHRQTPVGVQSVNRNSELLRCFLSLGQASTSAADPDALVMTAVLQNIDGQHDAALRTMAAAVRHEGSQSVLGELHGRHGAMLANSGRYQDAMASYARAISLRTDTPRLHYNMGISLMSTGKYAEAQSELVAALRLQCSPAVTGALRPDLRDSYRNIWTTLSLLCELQGRRELRMQAELGNLEAFTA